jgi:hypothetical protein
MQNLLKNRKSLMNQKLPSISANISVADGERSGVRGPIHLLKCTVMLDVPCKRDQCVVELYLAWPIWSRDLAPSTLSTCTPPFLPVYWGLSLLVALNKNRPGQWSGHLQAAQPRTCGSGKCMLILFFHSVQ